MYSKAKIVGHPVHPMLVTFPIAFYFSTLIAFIIFSASDNAFWFKVGVAANVAGVVMAVIAASFGFIDWYLGIPAGSSAKNTGLKHMALNSLTLILFLICMILNVGQWNAVTPVARGTIILPLIGVLLTVAAGYFGWTLVQKHFVGVDFTPDEERCISQVGGFTRRTV